jgi:hypothetical protein
MATPFLEMFCMQEFFRQLKIQRWDDHRYYHHSRINQSLHLISAISFVIAYGLLFVDPAAAALVAWLVSMTTRQSGHFFFEPLGYDEVNQASQEYKEEIKVGYNLRRKIVLLTIWVAAPLVLLVDPTFMGYFEAHTGLVSFARHTGQLWLIIGVGGLFFRTIHLFFIKDVLAGLVWMTKILTDPFHDIYLYHKAPLALLRGELIEPGPNMKHAPTPSQ